MYIQFRKKTILKKDFYKLGNFVKGDIINVRKIEICSGRGNDVWVQTLDYSIAIIPCANIKVIL